MTVRPDSLSPAEGAVESLIKLLADKDAQTRSRAARTLAAFRKEAKAAAPDLVHALEDSDKTLKPLAADLLFDLAFQRRALHQTIRRASRNFGNRNEM